MSDILSYALTEPVRPDYVIYHFTGGIYKLVHHKGNAPHFVSIDKRQKKGNDFKLDPAVSRARRMVLEYALCNDWKYFCTFTLDCAKHDRKDLGLWHKKFTQWLLDQRKKYKKHGLDLSFRYVLVPELHKDGSWHMHGLFSDISPVLISFAEERKQGRKLPDKLVNGRYLDWPAYRDNFGFCSFGIIGDRIKVGFYITKYISKQLQDSAVPVGLSLYYHSRPLKAAQLHGDIYGHCGALDKYLTNHYDFCDTGMTHVKDGLSWDFALEYMDHGTIEPLDISTMDSVPEVDYYFEAVQEVLEGFQ